MLEKQLAVLTQELNTLKARIKQRLEKDKQVLTETTQKLNESNHKLELSMKENKENEKVLEQLLKEFRELGEQLN